MVLLPHDYFVRDPNRRTLSLPLRIVKNLLGAGLVGLGVVMLFLPGQGVLTILFGLALVDFPQKQAWIKKLLDRPRLLESANRLRARFGKRPLIG